jgi:transcription antitermination factor NusG
MLRALRFGSFWHVLVVRCGQEFEAASLISGIEGVEAYAPAHRVWKRAFGHKARKLGKSGQMVAKPLLPGYVFFKADLGLVGARKILSKGEAICILTANGMACVVRDQLIEAFKLGEASGKWDQARFESKKLQLKIGTPHLIQSGPMRGFHGVLKTIDLDGPNESMTVTVELLQQNVDAVLDVNLEMTQ